MLSRRGLIIVAVLAAAVFAEEDPLQGLKINGWGWLTFGRVGSGFDQSKTTTEADIDFTKEYLSDFNAGVRIEKNFDETMRARFHFGMSTAYIVDNPKLLSYEFWQRKWGLYLIDAAIEKNVGFTESNNLLLEFGFLPVKTNPQAANLGEYLFRSLPYPATIVSGFELADKDKQVGFHAGYKQKMLEKSLLKADLYLGTEMTYMPIFDITPSGLLSFNLEEIFELGGGISFYSLFSIDKRKTTPGKDKKRISQFPERVTYIDTLGDTTFYTFRGTKLMGRFCFNPKAFFTTDIFGAEDLKIFAEVAVLGTKNYKGWYEDRSNRVPFMFGINIPTFKLLDICSFQLQYFKNPYWNATEFMWKSGSPIPYQGSITPIEFKDYQKGLADGSIKPITEDDWKWSLYMSRKINNRFRLSLQFANDNLMKTRYMPPPPTQSKYTEVMRDTWMREKIVTIDPVTLEETVTWGKEKWGMIKDWYWMARIMFYL